MVRSFILNKEQRQAVEDYLEHRPSVMSPQIRQIRLRARKLDYDRMSADLKLLSRLRDLKVPKGRKAKNVAAGFSVRQPTEKEVAASFAVKTEPITFVTSGLDVKKPEAPEEKK